MKRRRERRHVGHGVSETTPFGVCKLCAHRASCIIGRYLAPFDLQKKSVAFKPDVQHFRKRHLIFQAGAKPYGLFVVCAGRVKVFRIAESGRLLTTRIASPGELLGYRALFASEPYNAGAETLEDATVLFLDGKDVESLASTRPEFVKNLLRKVCIELGYAEHQETEMLYTPAAERLRQLLLYLGRLYSHRSDQEEVTILLTREEIAELCGLTPETTVRLLKEMERGGSVRSPRYAQLEINVQKLSATPVAGKD